MIVLGMVKGVIKAATPRINVKLAILEPIIFPKAISAFVFWIFALKEAMRETANSGSDVPNATSVKPMTTVDTPARLAMMDDDSITKSALFIKIKKPMTSTSI